MVRPMASGCGQRRRPRLEVGRVLAQVGQACLAPLFSSKVSGSQGGMDVDADAREGAGDVEASVRDAVNSHRKLARFFKAQAKALGNLDVPGAGLSLHGRIDEALAEAGRHDEEVRVLLQDKRNGLPDAVQLDKKQDFLKGLEGNLEKYEEEHRKILDKIAALHIEAEAKSEQVLEQQQQTAVGPDVLGCIPKGKKWRMPSRDSRSRAARAGSATGSTSGFSGIWRTLR